MKINLFEDSLAMWIVTTAIKNNFEIIDKFDNSQDGYHDIVLSVDGVELNFMNVINRINEIYDSAVEKAAGRMCLEKFDRRYDEITEELDMIAENLKKLGEIDFQKLIGDMIK